ncbi:MAG: hypothetical protein ACXV7J_12995 [Methylomonas sp.]
MAKKLAWAYTSNGHPEAISGLQLPQRYFWRSTHLSRGIHDPYDK